MKLKFETTLHAKVIVEATATPQKNGGVEVTVTAITPERAFPSEAVNILDALHPIDVDLAADAAMTEYHRRRGKP